MILVEHLHSLMYNLCIYCVQVLFTLWIDLNVQNVMCRELDVCRAVNIFSRSVSRLLDKYLIVLKEVLVNKQCLLNTQNVMCRSYTRRTSTPYTWTQYIFKLHCTQSLYNKIHVEYSNVPLSSRNISCSRV
jgi:hypothetical protein